MKKLFLLLIFNVLFASNLINVNFFEQKDKLDILLSLDKKFNGKIVEIKRNEFLLKGVKSKSEYYKNFDNFFVKSIKVKPVNEGILILINSKNDYTTSVALTPDGYGIRFRIIALKKEAKSLDLTKVNDKYNGLDYVSYLVSLLVLIIIAIILFLLRKKVKNMPINSDIKFLLQKPIDTKNKLVLIEFNNRKYLLVVGNSNILLDIFDENMVNISTGENFDKYLKNEVNDKLDYLKEYIENAEKLKELNERI